MLSNFAMRPFAYDGAPSLANIPFAPYEGMYFTAAATESARTAGGDAAAVGDTITELRNWDGSRISSSKGTGVCTLQNVAGLREPLWHFDGTGGGFDFDPDGSEFERLNIPQNRMVVIGFVLDEYSGDSVGNNVAGMTVVGAATSNFGFAATHQALLGNGNSRINTSKNSSVGTLFHYATPSHDLCRAGALACAWWSSDGSFLSNAGTCRHRVNESADITLNSSVGAILGSHDYNKWSIGHIGDSTAPIRPARCYIAYVGIWTDLIESQKEQLQAFFVNQLKPKTLLLVGDSRFAGIPGRNAIEAELHKVHPYQTDNIATGAATIADQVASWDAYRATGRIETDVSILVGVNTIGPGVIDGDAAFVEWKQLADTMIDDGARVQGLTDFFLQVGNGNEAEHAVYMANVSDYLSDTAFGYEMDRRELTEDQTTPDQFATEYTTDGVHLSALGEAVRNEALIIGVLYGWRVVVETSGADYIADNLGAGLLAPATFQGEVITYFGSFGADWFNIRLANAVPATTVVVDISGIGQATLVWNTDRFEGDWSGIRQALANNEGTQLTMTITDETP